MEIEYQHTGVVSYDMGSRSMAVVHVGAHYTFLKAQIVDLGGAKKTTQELVDRLCAVFQPGNELAWALDVPQWCVEFQPTSGPVRILQYVLQAIFLCKFSSGCGFRFYMPGEKFKIFSSPLPEEKTRTYNHRKKTAVEITLSYLPPDLVTWFCKYKTKQQSDLADAYLQGIRYLQKTNPQENPVLPPVFF